MLIKATEKDIEEYIDFAYSLALDQTRSGYPLFSDGILTKENFVSWVWRSYKEERRELLLFILDNKVEGIIQFFYIEEDNYLQTDGFYINKDTEQALEEFIEYGKEYFAGYDLYLGFPKKNSHAVAYLENIGGRLAEEAYHDVFSFEKYEIQPEDPGLTKVTKDNFSAFRSIHMADQDTYWNADRIYETLDDWTIYLLCQNGTAAGYVNIRSGEIFDLGYRDAVYDEKVYKALVTKVLNDSQKAGYPYMTFFNDDKTQSAALDLGFTCVSEYVLYIISV